MHPDFSPDDFEQTLTRVSHMAAEYLRGLPERPAFVRPPDDVIARFEQAPLPLEGADASVILDDLERDVLPYSLGIGHPRWWGYIRGSAAPLGMAADLLAATMNNNCAGSAQIATWVEMCVMRWLAELVGYEPSAGGILLSGGSAANFVALAAMRERMLPGTRKTGLGQLGIRPTVYVTHETHSSIRRAVEMLGLGDDSLRLVPIAGRVFDIKALRAAIKHDRADGCTPLCVVGTAGTVNTGAIDPLADLRKVTDDEGLWFHVDGAYGAALRSLPELADRYRGMELADSLTMNPHKWLYVPYEAGAVLVKDRNALTQAFATKADYLEVEDNDWYNGPLWYHQQGPQLSRAFRALKVYAVIRRFGLNGYHELWRHDLAMAAELRRQVAAHPRLELVGETDLSIVCFRYLPTSGNADAINKKLVDHLQKDGRVFLSGTTVDGIYCLRACIVNARTEMPDTAVAVEVVTELGDTLVR